MSTSADRTATETALIVPVPAADPVVARHRRTLDHSAMWGVPAHVTVLYPFLPPALLTPAVIEDVRACVAEVPAFACAFGRVAWFGADVVWLAPDPAEPFRVLTDQVRRRFPDYQPYGGAFPDSTPHLTVGSTRLGGLADLRRAAAAVEPELPIRATIDRVRLLAGTDAPDGWHPVTDFALPAG